MYLQVNGEYLADVGFDVQTWEDGGVGLREVMVDGTSIQWGIEKLRTRATSICQCPSHEMRTAAGD